ncbi:hypothetical protein J416_03811 [Gracilibacillus halophilus YIM-C55.5]|uniref:Uncharacterized protein n=1 Tax=Gracilibacillus halophilus YIM-C55.5 TaxID=1308866 RepID=N4WEI9_9BACI|nr:hypothetical protein [Gracilibacillus halophilus]ENH97664.1 hypothetical protein J416_03811 [Gracilibacillus halophilus YIM-C55.5]
MMKQRSIDKEGIRQTAIEIDKYHNGVYAYPVTDPKEKKEVDRQTREFIKNYKEQNKERIEQTNKTLQNLIK